MPSIQRHSNMPTVVQSKAPAKAPRSPKSPKERTVGFPASPVTGISRPVNPIEIWALYNFEVHARRCAYCYNPYEVHRSGRQLCEAGHCLAQDVASWVYRQSDGHTYSTQKEDHQVVRVEIPAGYDQALSLLRAIERSLRHRRRAPFVSLDRSYYIPPRMPERSKSVKVTHAPKKETRTQSETEIVERPRERKSTIDVSRRGSLYVADLAEQRRASVSYNVEIRQPSPIDIRERRSSGYWR